MVGTTSQAFHATHDDLATFLEPFDIELQCDRWDNRWSKDMDHDRTLLTLYGESLRKLGRRRVVLSDPNLSAGPMFLQEEKEIFDVLKGSKIQLEAMSVVTQVQMDHLIVLQKCFALRRQLRLHAFG